MAGGGRLAIKIGLAALAGLAFALGRVTVSRPAAPAAPAEGVTGVTAPPAIVQPADTARQFARLRQELLDEIRREHQRQAAAAPVPPAVDPAAAEPPPAETPPPPTAENLQAASRAADLVGRVEGTHTLTLRQRAELQLLLGQMDQQSRYQTLSRLAQGINEQRIKSAVETESETP